MSQPSVYFASTILHLYVSSVIAADREEEAHLFFIDQPEGKDFPLFELTQKWQSSPFTSVNLFHGRFKGLSNKLIQRKALFKQLDQLIEELKPKHIFVGNDRRIEFQWSMHVATQMGLNPIGHYMDEGTYTYLGREASSGFSDKVLDNIVKKLSYGFWWKNPPTIGGSEWITQVHAAFPDHVHPLLKGKQFSAINPDGFRSPALRDLSDSLMQYYGFDSSALGSLDTLFTLPHESLFEKESGYKDEVLAEINSRIASGKKVAAKYHPRNRVPDALNLQKEGVVLLPAGISFEAMLPHFSEGMEIVGDISSTLLIARWLREDLKVISIKESDNSLLSDLFKKIGVQMKS